jgi:hypothetical protein
MKRLLILSGCLLLLIGLPIAQAQSIVVESLSVHVTSTTAPPPDKVAKRMADSIAMVGQQILLGKSLDEVTLNKNSYEKVIREVFERVLVGYSVQNVNIIPDTETGIQVTIEPWGDVVHQVKIETNFIGLSPEMQSLAVSQLTALSGKTEDTLTGLPIDAVDWAGSILKDNLRELIADRLPEFKAAFEIQSGSVTVIKMTLSPVGEVIQDVNVSVGSKTLPNFLLSEAEQAADELGQNLRGLPISFVQRHKDYFEQKILHAVTALPVTERYGLTFKPVVLPASSTSIILNANTTKYKFFVEGYLDMGRKMDNTSVKIHAGKWLTPKDEVFMEGTFVPGSVRWEFMPGWGHQFTKQTQAGFKYSMTDKRNRLFIEQELGPNYSLRIERIPIGSFNEVGLRYKIHEYLSAEYVINNHESYLRLVGSL